MPDREQVNITVSPEQKAKWTKYAEENPEVSSQAHLIRMAVEHEIAGESIPEDTTDDARLIEMHDMLREMDATLDDLTTRMRAIESLVEHRPQVTELAGNIYDRLPTERPGTEVWENHVASWRPEMYEVWPGTKDAFAKVLDSSERRVERALEHLQENSSRVRVTAVNGQNRYWKDE